jgi:hypothetical protein
LDGKYLWHGREEHGKRQNDCCAQREELHSGMFIVESFWLQVLPAIADRRSDFCFLSSSAAQKRWMHLC